MPETLQLEKLHMACNTNSGSAVYVLNDGRAFTDYRPNCELNEYLKAKYAPGASSEYRMFLQHNACALMKEQREMNGFVNPSGSYCNYSHPPIRPAKLRVTAGNQAPDT